MYKKLKYNVLNIITITIIFNFIIANVITVMAYDKNAYTNNINSFKDKLDNLVPKLQKRYGVPGTSIGIIENGKVVYILNYGVSNKKQSTLVNESTIFQIGSVSKSLTAWGVMRLVEEGKISLDDPVEKYLTGWHFPKSKFNSDAVTIRRLLNHTAGLSVHGYSGIKPGEEIPRTEQSLSGNNNGAGKVEIIIEPGSKYLYSGGGYTVLQLLIEEVTKMPFEKYMSEEVLMPLGMEHSSFANDFTDTNISKAYGFFGQALPNYNYTEKSAAGLKTTVQDFLKFMLASMDGNNGEPKGREILKSENIDLILNSGLGTFKSALPDNSAEIGHVGSNKGWTSQYQIIPKRKDGLIIVTNSDNGFYLTEEVTDFWIEYETGTLPLKYYKIQNVSKAFFAATILMGLLLIFYCISFSVNFKKRKRILFFKKEKKSIVKLCIRLTTPLFLVFIWYYLFYYANLAFLMLYGFLMITYLITIWSIVLFISALFPKTK